MRTARAARDEPVRELYAGHAGGLLAYVARLVNGDRQLAEDIVQETFLRAWRSDARLDPEHARAWLRTTARHLVIDVYRARSARPVEASAELLDSTITGDGVDAALDAVLLADALHSLSAAHRTVLIECYYRGFTAAQIAERLGLPVGTVRSRIHYALRALRLALQERGVNAR